MFKALFKGAGKGEKPRKRATSLEDLVADEEIQGDRIALAAIHAQFDTMGQPRRVDDPHTTAMVKVIRSHG